MSYKLVSFPICPYVQRSVIMMKLKKQDFEIEYVDLQAMPDWYLARVPTGRVPSLWIDGHVLFESAAINEFINETTPGNLFPEDALTRARARAWIAYADQLFGNQFRMLTASDFEKHEAERAMLISDTMKLADVIEGPYFFGDSLTLTDVAFAPLFMRMKLVESVYAELEEKAGKESALMQWIDTLASLPEVKDSVLPDFSGRFYGYFRSRGSLCV